MRGVSSMSIKMHTSHRKELDSALRSLDGGEGEDEEGWGGVREESGGDKWEKSWVWGTWENEERGGLESKKAEGEWRRRGDLVSVCYDFLLPKQELIQ